MSRTRHHVNQKRQHQGQDYWSRMSCNKHGASPYGVEGRNRADTTRRTEDKKIIKAELFQLVE